jgi:uncharacterized membrane protein SpoIIM required for sporulation
MFDVIALAIMGAVGLTLAWLAVWGADRRDERRRQRELDQWYRDEEGRR